MPVDVNEAFNALWTLYNASSEQTALQPADLHELELLAHEGLKARQQKCGTCNRRTLPNDGCYLKPLVRDSNWSCVDWEEKP